MSGLSHTRNLHLATMALYLVAVPGGFLSVHGRFPRLIVGCGVDMAPQPVSAHTDLPGTGLTVSSSAGAALFHDVTVLRDLVILLHVILLLPADLSSARAGLPGTGQRTSYPGNAVFALVLILIMSICASFTVTASVAIITTITLTTTITMIHITTTRSLSISDRYYHHYCCSLSFCAPSEAP